jgi:hypothetical protein
LAVPFERWQFNGIPCSRFCGVDLPVEYDTMPLHVLGVDSAEKEQAATRLIVEQPALWDIYMIASSWPGCTKPH